MKVQTPFWVKKRNQMGPVKVGFDGKFWENSRADSISFCPCSPLAFALAFVSFWARRLWVQADHSAVSGGCGVLRPCSVLSGSPPRTPALGEARRWAVPKSDECFSNGLQRRFFSLSMLSSELRMDLHEFFIFV